MNVIVSNRYQTLLSELDIDIIKTINGEFTVEDLAAQFANFYFNKMILDITAVKDYQDIATIQRLSINLDMSKVILLLDDSPESSSSTYLSQLISMGIYNFTKNIDNIKYLIDNPNSYKDVAHIHQINTLTNTIVDKVERSNVKVFGIKNITDHAGATTLIYMLKKELEAFYKVLAIEVGRNDFLLFNDPELISTTTEEFTKIMNEHSDYEVILIDLNDSNEEDNCDDVLYLIEPSTIKLNRMIRRNRHIFEKLKGKKIILNKSLLDTKDITDFEYESRSEVFFNVPPLNDKEIRHPILNELLSKLGLVREQELEQTDVKEENKILGLFKL